VNFINLKKQYILYKIKLFNSIIYIMDSLKKLHEGTYGTIYENNTTSDIYKVSKHKDIDTSFIRELYFLQYLTNNPYVIQIKDVKIMEELNGNICSNLTNNSDKRRKQRRSCIVMEKMDYNLRDFVNECIEKKSKNVLKIMFKYIFIKLLYAVNELQTRHILHNDLKLINILINRHNVFRSDNEEDLLSFKLKICDFGLAIQTSYMDMDECICLGTVKYSAPEMVNDSVKKFYGFNEHRCNKYKQSLAMDLYSIGIIMAQILIKFCNIPNIDKMTQDTLHFHLENHKNIVDDFLPKTDNNYRILYNYLNEDPSKRIKIRNVFKVLLKDYENNNHMNNYVNNHINVNYSDYLKNNLPKYSKDNYQDFVKMLNKMNEYLIKHYNYSIEKLNYELQFNIYHMTYYLHFIHRISLSDSVKISIYWVLSIYHHRELSNFKKIIKSTKFTLKKNELEVRPLLMKYTKIIPISYFFKTIHIKPKTKQQLLMLMFK